MAEEGDRLEEKAPESQFSPHPPNPLSVHGEGAGDEVQGAGEETGRLRQELAAREGRIVELEAALAGLEEVRDRQEETLAAEAREIASFKERLGTAVARYREALLARAPEVPADLVAGETAEEVEASLEKARGVVERVRQHLQAASAAQKVPAGAPARRAPDLSALSPREKIAYALSRRQG